MVNVATFGCDRSWKRKILTKVPPASTRVLDLACGTGIVTFAIARRYPNCHVIGVDVTKEYLDVARAKAERERIKNVEFIHKRAEDAIIDEPFDCVTASYLPKYADLKTLTRNIKAMLKEDGAVVMHDFTYPPNRLVASLWELYFKLLQTAGRLIFPKWGIIYDELPLIVRETTWLPDLVSCLQQNGFHKIMIERLIVGSAAIVTARNEK